MKKHISLALAVAASIACTKVAPEDLNSIETIPQDENKESISDEPQGEKIMIQVPQTKVTLSGDHYVFESGDVITVVATNGAYASMTTSDTGEQGQFEGEFNSPVGKTSDTFKFYYNYSETTPEQNGKPWLVATAECSREAGSNTFKADDGTVNFEHPSNTSVLALNSSYNCTVDFHTLDGNQNISGITVSQGTPYFMNVTGGMSGGFYLAVNKTGETGTMYTAYGTSTTISSNQIVKIKDAFIPLSGTVSFDGFKTTYDIAQTDVTTANATNSNVMTAGTISLSLSGISSTLDLVESVTFFDGDTEFTLTEREKSGNTYTFSVAESNTHNDFGQRTLTAKINFKNTVSSSTNISGQTIRHITGLPYNACPTKDTWTNNNIYNWSVTNTYGGGLMYNDTADSESYIQKEFWVPEKFNIKLTHSGYTRKGTLTSTKTTFTIHLGSNLLYTITSSNTSSPGEKTNVSYDTEFTPIDNYIKCTSTKRYQLSTYATTNNVTLHYR